MLDCDFSSCLSPCAGARSERSYHTEFAEQVPQDCIILTLACGKYRFNKQKSGTLGGLPRLLDLSRCNGAYSALKIAQALASASNCGGNDLPLSLMLKLLNENYNLMPITTPEADLAAILS